MPAKSAALFSEKIAREIDRQLRRAAIVDKFAVIIKLLEATTADEGIPLLFQKVSKFVDAAQADGRQARRLRNYQAMNPDEERPKECN